MFILRQKFFEIKLIEPLEIFQQQQFSEFQNIITESSFPRAAVLRILSDYPVEIAIEHKQDSHKNIFRSSCLEMFCRKGVLRNFAKFTGKHLCKSLFFNKITGIRAANLLKRYSGNGVFL